ncbi:unnamed protein product [Cylicocyclus nassatus]|uniref:Uncharacterized protein n=1 Tax=Cylicocyclus nassatus TaxID=53992 RepID=A0AA36H3E0_CYLNA|nr:unnamed protein product [Cylicocyclus nassatus]
MRSLLIWIITLLSSVVAHSQEGATLPSEMSEASAQASRPYRVKVTSPHPFARQIGPPMSGKRVITPVPNVFETPNRVSQPFSHSEQDFLQK